MERYVAIDNVCAWPNLTLLPNGDIAATIFNQPCHGQWEGDVECWVSNDSGVSWQPRGVPAPHEPETNRMNVAAGQAQNGDLVVLASGWSNKPVAQPVKNQPFRSEILTPWICRSEDNGQTWRQSGKVALPDIETVIPFGDILPGADGTLHAAAYTHPACNVVFLISTDDGYTWQNYVPLAEDGRHNETDILHLGNGKWLAASRTADERNLDLFVSEDNGKTWRFERMLTGPDMHPAHLLRLNDDRIMLSFGIRFGNHHGIGIRISEDEGTSWGRVKVITKLEGAKDIGYPSSIQCEDGTIVTAWYANGTTRHARYHMGVTRWQPDEI